MGNAVLYSSFFIAFAFILLIPEAYKFKKQISKFPKINSQNKNIINTIKVFFFKPRITIPVIKIIPDLVFYMGKIRQYRYLLFWGIKIQDINIFAIKGLFQKVYIEISSIRIMSAITCFVTALLYRMSDPNIAVYTPQSILGEILRTILFGVIILILIFIFVGMHCIVALIIDLIFFHLYSILFPGKVDKLLKASGLPKAKAAVKKRPLKKD